MKISFPHMGTSHIAIGSFLEALGHEAVYPPKPTNKTLSLGVQHAPEFACLPFKILLGTYLEAVEKGAEIIVTSGGFGPCRAGYYGSLHQGILDDIGCHVPILMFEPPLQAPLDFCRSVYRVVRPQSSWYNLYRSFKLLWAKMSALDDIEATLNIMRPRVLQMKELDKAYHKALSYIRQAKTVSQVEEARAASLTLMQGVPADHKRELLRIGIIGEIYVVLEPAANYDLEKMLAEKGAQPHRSIRLADWTINNATPADGERSIKDAAAPYLDQLVGGHGQTSVGETVLYGEDGYDGVIQLAPFTCIPEIVAKSILPAVSKDKDIPVLTVFLDEQTARTGIETRVEAFLDLLRQKRRQREAI